MNLSDFDRAQELQALLDYDSVRLNRAKCDLRELQGLIAAYSRRDGELVKILADRADALRSEARSATDDYFSEVLEAHALEIEATSSAILFWHAGPDVITVDDALRGFDD